MKTKHAVKRLFCVFLVAVMILSFVLPAGAKEINADSVIYERVAEAVALDSFASGSPLSSCSPETIKLGMSITVYKLVEGQVVSSQAVYVPVFSGKDLVALAFVTVKNGGVVSVEIADDLVPELAEFIDEDICLIFGKTDTYIYCDNQISLLKSYSHILGNEVNLTTASAVEREEYTLSAACNKLSTKKLSGEYLLSNLNVTNVCATPVQIARAGTLPTSSSLYTLVIPQYDYNICWAAVVASIGYQQTGVKKTAVNVATWLNPSNFNQGASIYQALLAMQEIYNLDGTDLYYAPSFTQIKSEIYDNQHPIYTRFWEGSGSNDVKHAVFIDGYMDYSSGSYIGRLSIGDPATYSDEVYQYRALFFTQDTVYPLTVNGVTTYANAHILLY